MDTEEFLARVIAPGNFIAVNYKNANRGMGARFFPRDDVAGAAGFIRWASNKGMDAWHACASYRMASPDGVDNRGKAKFTGERTAANAMNFRCLWVDLDVKRDGDKKQDGAVYADLRAAVEWLVKSFLPATKLPPPNLWVGSGYGLHIYWVLDDAMTREEWQPYADGLKAALIAHGALTDVGISADAARILRPVGSQNWKVPAAPRPVVALKELGDYPNAMVLDPLKVYAASALVGVSGAVMVPTATAVRGAAALAGGNVSPIFAGRQAASAAAAQANVPAGRDYMFAEIGKKCGQVRQSLAVNGRGDPYPLWYLGLLSLAHHCSDGALYVHPVGNGDPRYNPTGTDDAVARIAHEKLTKPGAPTCAHFNARGHQGVCQACPHWGRIHTPLVLGVADGDLPDRYRRYNGIIQRLIASKDGPQWVDLVAGDVHSPVLDRVGDSYHLTFSYERAGRSSSVLVEHGRVPFEASKTAAHFGQQGITLGRDNALDFGDFTVAWINRLRDCVPSVMSRSRRSAGCARGILL